MDLQLWKFRFRVPQPCTLVGRVDLWTAADGVTKALDAIKLGPVEGEGSLFFCIQTL